MSKINTFWIHTILLLSTPILHLPGVRNVIVFDRRRAAPKAAEGGEKAAADDASAATNSMQRVKSFVVVIIMVVLFAKQNELCRESRPRRK